MQPAPFTLIADLIEDSANGWSIGSFGAIGEFMRDPDEPAAITRTSDQIEVVTARGAIRVADTAVKALAWDTLSKDGESWGHAMAFCVPQSDAGLKVVRSLGLDENAIRPEDRASELFDLGVACGSIIMCARTHNPELIAALKTIEGSPVLESAEIMPAMLKAQPHRVLLSPAGRVEVFQPIPPADGKSPEGPHTHLLPKLIAKNRPHSANTPIPEGWQAALSMHPKSPWRTMLGEKHPFEPETDQKFRPLLDQYASEEDRSIEQAITQAQTGDDFIWPTTRRGRHKARITLRRMHAAGDLRLEQLRQEYDRLPVETEEGEEE